VDVGVGHNFLWGCCGQSDHQIGQHGRGFVELRGRDSSGDSGLWGKILGLQRARGLWHLWEEDKSRDLLKNLWAP
jgi:hypothetical protein